jgi:hypothetical protein
MDHSTAISLTPIAQSVKVTYLAILPERVSPHSKLKLRKHAPECGEESSGAGKNHDLVSLVQDATVADQSKGKTCCDTGWPDAVNASLQQPGTINQLFFSTPR